MKMLFRIGVCLLLVLASMDSMRAATVSVDIINFGFSPDPVTVNAGDTVVWTQRDPSVHTTTSGPDGVPDGFWDSGSMFSGQTFSYTFTAAGSFPYFCIPHSGFMRGTVIVQGAGGGNQPPTVSLTSPGDGQRFTAPASITITANANDPNGSVASVEFFDNGASLGVRTGLPYSMTATFQAGFHTLTAKATDTSGAATTSGAVNITVDPPGKQNQTITFTQPGNATYGAGPITIDASANSGLPVSFTLLAGPAILNGNRVTITGAGHVMIRASQSGDANYNPAPDQEIMFDVAKASLRITADDARRVFGAANPALTYSISGFVNGDGLSAFSGTPNISTAANSQSSPGTYPIVANVGTLAAANYSFALNNGVLTIDKAPQTITFSPPLSAAYGDSPLALSAVTSSGLAVIVAFVSGPGTLQGNSLSFTGAGQITLRASQAGDANFLPASSVEKTISVSPAMLMVAARNVTRSYGTTNPPLSYSATGFVNGDTEAVLLGSAELSTAADKTSAPGIYPIALRAGTLSAANYAFAFSDGTFTITKADQTITFPEIPAHAYGDAPFRVTALASSGLPVSFNVIGGPAIVAGDQVTLTGAGPVSLRASQGGDVFFNSAQELDRSFTVTKADQTITFPAIPNHLRGDAPFALSASASSGLPVAFAIVTGPAAITTNQLRITGAGTVTVRASQDGDDRFNAAASQDQTFTVTDPVPLDAKVEISIRGNELRVDWAPANFRLQEADSVSGPWQTVPGISVPPYVLSPAAARAFYRLIQP